MKCQRVILKVHFTCVSVSIYCFSLMFPIVRFVCIFMDEPDRAVEHVV